VISLGKKTLAAEEQVIATQMEYSAPGFGDLIAEVYSLARADASHYPKLFMLVDAFDANVSQVWYDFSHITPEGNKIVSERMLDLTSQ
jgi:hypothetical protein